MKMLVMPVSLDQPLSAASAVEASVSTSASPARASLPSAAPASVAPLEVSPRSPGKAPLPAIGSSVEHARSTTIGRAVSTKSTRRTAASLAHLVLAAVAGVAALLAVGCSSSSGASAGEGVGNRIISDIVACKADTDCDTAAGEMCGEGFCQMRRCSAKTYTSTPPFGQSGYAYLDRGFVIGSPASSFEVLGAHTKAGTKVNAKGAAVDAAGGNLTGKRPESIAYLTGGSEIAIVGVDGAMGTSLQPGFTGAHVATGDVDGDGVDEIVVTGGTKYAVCSAVKGTCTNGTLSAAMTDVTVGDVNGDGLGEILFVNDSLLTVVDSAAGKVSTQPLSETLEHVTAGDLDGDGKDEIIGISRGGFFSADTVHVYTLSGILAPLADLALPENVNNRTLDVQFTKQDDAPVVGVLADGSTLLSVALRNGALANVGTTSIPSQAGHVLAAADAAQRSALVTLKGPAKLQVAPVVPVAVLTFPPYSATHSAGPSSVSMGQSKSSSTSEGSSQSASSSVSLQLSFAANIPVAGGNLHGSVSRSYSRSVSRSKSSDTSTSVGGSYSASADPAADGYNSGNVVLGGGCFHQYDYTVDDPQKVLSDSQPEVSMFVPIGGETSVWSTARYNALSDAMGDGRLPKVTITPRLGNVDSYPSTPTTLDGKPIPNDDNVFLETPVYRSSDSANVSFDMSISQSKSNSTSLSFNYGSSNSISGGLSVVSVSQSKDSSWGLDTSYSVSVSNSTSFSGTVSAVRDDPSTPANESSLYAYSFRPYVYRHHFKDKSGKAGAFYALTYTVGQ